MEHNHGVRTIDELGRFVLPSELRKKLDWSISDKISVIEKEGTIILRLFEKSGGPKCTFCGMAESATRFKGADICKECLEKIKAS